MIGAGLMDGALELVVVAHLHALGGRLRKPAPVSSGGPVTPSKYLFSNPGTAGPQDAPRKPRVLCEECCGGGRGPHPLSPLERLLLGWLLLLLWVRTLAEDWILLRLGWDCVFLEAAG